MSLSKDEEKARLLRFVQSLPGASYLHDIFADGLAHEIERAIDTDIAFVMLQERMAEQKRYRDDIARLRAEQTDLQAKVKELKLTHDMLEMQVRSLKQQAAKLAYA